MTATTSTPDTMRTVTAGELRLEPQRAEHAAAMFVVLSDPAIYEFEHEPPASCETLRARYAELETRRSESGGEQCLHWVVHLAGEGLVGGVQATVDARGQAGIAYEFGSRWWGRGIACRSVQAMLGELRTHHRVRRCTAVLKQENLRSYHLLRRLRFTMATPAQHAAHGVERDEWLMQRELNSIAHTA